MYLGIGGKAGAGKSTVVNFLVKSLGFEEVELAGNMKKFLSSELNIPLNHFYDIEEKNKERIEPVIVSNKLISSINEILSSNYNNKKISLKEEIYCFSYRELLQFFGTEILRQFNEDIHIKWGISTAKQKDNLIFQAIRFPNELEYVKSINGFNIYVKRNDFSVLTSTKQEQHSSENSVTELDFDFALSNTRDVDTLYWQVENLIAFIKNKVEGK